MYLDFLSQYQPINNESCIDYTQYPGNQKEDFFVLSRQQNILDMELDEGRFDDLTPEKVMSIEFIDDNHFKSYRSSQQVATHLDLGEILEDAERIDNEEGI